MPLLGQTMEEGTIIKWFKNEGDQVTEGEPLLEVMTDKVNMEVEATATGVLRKILAQPDDVVPVKDTIAIIGTADEPIDDLLSGAPAAAPVPTEPAQALAFETQATPAEKAVEVSAEGGEGRIIASPSAKRVAKEHGINIDALAGKGTGPNGRITEKDVLEYASSAKATPLAGKVAADMGVDISAVVGTGIGGKVTKEDVECAVAPAAPATAPAVAVAPASIGATIPFTGMRKMVAQNVAMSYQQNVHVTLVTEVDMTECVKLRGQILADVEKNYGVRISYTDIIAKAVTRTILDKPIVNASLKDDKIVISDHINLGIATAIQGGLIVPVVKDAQGKSLVQISKEIKELVGRARSGQATGDDLSGGTFTITNLGVFGIDSFSPIITPGQSAILAVCRIVEKPVVVNGEIAVRSKMNLCLSFDHKVMDGAPAAEFLARLREVLESPYLIFV